MRLRRLQKGEAMKHYRVSYRSDVFLNEEDAIFTTREAAIEYMNKNTPWLIEEIELCHSCDQEVDDCECEDEYSEDEFDDD